MSKDLVKRLQDHVIHLDAWGKEAIPDADLVEEAADRIEKLEALVEQLRDDNSSIMDSFDEDFLRQDDRIERLEAAVRRIADLTEFWEHDLISQVNEIARKALEGEND